MISARPQSGFSLIELSIVLVILGLLTGGILGGQALIRAAELRAVSTEYNRWVTATQTFRDKYLGLPGDLTNAHLFWGARDGNNGYGNDCRMETNASGTCSGNGNGIIIGWDGVDEITTSATYETYLFWDHLVRAGLIEGRYSGNPATIGSNTLCINTVGSVPGCNVPISKFSSDTMWQIYSFRTLTGHAYLFDGNYGHSLYLMRGPGWIGPLGGKLTTEEIWNLDSKMDDGRPATGNLVVSRWHQCALDPVSTADPGVNEYRLRLPSWGTDWRCIPVFRNLF